MDRIGRKWPAYTLVVPWMLLAAAVVLELATPERVSAAPLLALACVFAGSTASLRTTATVSAVAVAFEVLSGMPHGLFEAHEVVENVFVLLAGLLAVDLNRLLHRYGHRIEAAETVARAAQLALLPVPPREVGGFRIAAVYRTAEARARIGGDVYGVQDSPFGVRALIGDVRGKGLGAVSTVAVLLAVFREAADEEPDLVGVADRLERCLQREGRRRGGLEETEGFTTALLAEFPPGGGTVRLLNCGHPSPYTVDAAGIRALDPGEFSLPLGMGVLAAAGRTVDEHPFPDGTCLVLVTDGITEARNHAGEFFVPLTALTDCAPGDPDAVLAALLRAVRAWSGPAPDDDSAVMVVNRCPVPGGDRHRAGHSVPL
ncbi:PP2C family protein-serine/threonine phosphatase [Streptomyces genisteinicus]|uniref:Serine/threonine-protein phosphatase n=1 Tax=Streptomyces genisteinicus TaxID=2768068 RepID=A0A7H0HMH0_9ACTN|nr:PP2C family protein-serine/threonine phosphatase [Streptomyces genisteinicus]QNP61736.1 serine/threonine-protein phosphatase [Streptomyces genisteinicus]